MLICSKCGANITEEQLFCPDCGNEVHLVAEYDMTDDLMISPDIANEPAKGSGKKSAFIYDKIGLVLVRRNNKKVFFAVIFALFLSLFVLLLINYSRNQNSIDYHLKKALQYHEEKKYDLSIKSAEKALNLDKVDPRPYEMLGDNYFMTDRTDEALHYYELAITHAPETFDYYIKAFDLFERKGDFLSIRTYIDGSSLKTELEKFYPMCYPQKPVFGPLQGSYSENIAVQITADSDSAIYYSLDGSRPKRDSLKYEKPIKLDHEGLHVIKAIAVNSFGIESEIGTASYELAYPVPRSPVVTPGTGRYGPDTLIKVITDDNCNAYYTWGASIPDENSNKYSLPIKMKKGSHTFTVICINEYGKASLPTVRSFDVADEESE